MRTAIVGGGIMGGGITVALTRAGHAVTVVEPETTVADALRARLSEAIPAVDGAVAPEVVDDLAAVSGVEFVVEAAPEDLRLKVELWRRLGETAPRTAVLATNTSSLDVDLLAECVPHPSRVLATHWFNPAYEIECVEVAPGRATDPSVLEWTFALLRRAGKRPVVVRNSAGFVANRIQFAAIREALLCVAEGIPARDVDEIVRTSFAPRLAALGPLANADLGGLDTYLAIFEVLCAAHGERFAPPDVLAELVSVGHLGLKSGSGVTEYSAEELQALAQIRDARLSRIIAAVGEGATALSEQAGLDRKKQGMVPCAQ